MKTMRNFNYSVIITSESKRFTYESNDVREAIRASFEGADGNSEVCICNGCTGEVLFHNGEEPYCTDEMSLMMLGFLMEESWGEQEEEENEPVEAVAETPVVAVRIDALAEQTGGDLVLAMIEDLVAQGKAIHLPS